jgi:hypothetical protein
MSSLPAETFAGREIGAGEYARVEADDETSAVRDAANDARVRRPDATVEAVAAEL